MQTIQSKTPISPSVCSHVALDNIQKAIPDAFKVVHLDRVLPIRR